MLISSRRVGALAVLGTALTAAVLASPTAARAAGLITTVTPLSSDPAQVGRWSDVGNGNDLLAVHATLGYDQVTRQSKLLIVEGSANDEGQFLAGTFRVAVWNLTTGVYTHLPNTPTDMFCGGHVTLGTGQTLIAGGTTKYGVAATGAGFQGDSSAYLFDWTSETLTPVSPMNKARWYPGATLRGNGTVLITSGLDANGLLTDVHENYDPATQQFTINGQTRRFPLYPQMFLRPNGEFFYTGAYSNGPGVATAGTWNSATNSYKTVQGLSTPEVRSASMSVLLPPAQKERYITFGGGGELNGQSTASIDGVTLTDSLPRYLPVGRLPLATVHPSGVILPDDNVLIAGGSAKLAREPQLQAVLFNAASNAMTIVQPNRYPRSYHSAALLLPDGRVLMMGGNPSDGPVEMRMEVFEPPYLFKGQRPVISSGDEAAYYGHGISVHATTATGKWKHWRLVRPMSVTHSDDTNQRSVEVPYTTVTGSDQVKLQIPGNPNLLPPGWYMLFGTDDQGRPSDAHWLYVSTDPHAGSGTANPTVVQQVKDKLPVKP